MKAPQVIYREQPGLQNPAPHIPPLLCTLSSPLDFKYYFVCGSQLISFGAHLVLMKIEVRAVGNRGRTQGTQIGWKTQLARLYPLLKQRWPGQTH